MSGTTLNNYSVFKIVTFDPETYETLSGSSSTTYGKQGLELVTQIRAKDKGDAWEQFKAWNRLTATTYLVLEVSEMWQKEVYCEFKERQR